MSALPDFTKLSLRADRCPRPRAARALGDAGRPRRRLALHRRRPEADLDALDTYPGLPPFVRGPYPTMYVNQPWTIRQYAGFSTAEESNAFYRRNLAGGQKGLSVAFDLATHRGYDSDHPRVSGDVGLAGVAIDSILDMRTLFDRIPLGEVSVSMTMNGAVLPILALYIVAAEEQGVAQDKLAGTIQNDILKEFMVRNTYIYPPRSPRCGSSPTSSPTRRSTCRASTRSRSPATTCRRRGRRQRPRARLHARRRRRVHPGRAGSAGLDIDAFAPRLSFFWAIGMNFFMEVAKMRAARLLWCRSRQAVFAEEREVAGSCARIARRRAGRSPRRTCGTTSCAPRSRRWRRPPGHTQSLHTNALDEALALPTDESCAHRPQHADLPARGERHRPHHRPMGRLVLRRAADARPRRSRARAHGGDRVARRHGQGDRGRPAEAAHRGDGDADAGAHRRRHARR